MSRKLMALSAAAVFGLYLAGCGGEGKMDDMAAAGGGVLSAKETKLVEDYDALAKEILKVHPNETEVQKQKELQIVGELLAIYRAEAENAFAAAKAVKGEAQAGGIKKAIESVTKLALEGDKRVNDIKLALQKGGHHHTKAEGSDEEYIYIDAKAKKALMEDVNKLRALLVTGKEATAAELDAIAADVFATVDGAMKKKT